MKYIDDNLDSSAVEILPERKRSSFSWGNLLDTLILFGGVYFLCWFFCHIRYDLSVLDDMDYNIPLRDIVIIANGFDIHNLILPVSIVITLIFIKIIKLIELALISPNLITSLSRSNKYRFGLILLGLLFYVGGSMLKVVVSSLYLNSIKEENAKNAGNKYIVNVDIRRIDDSIRGEDEITFVFNDREVYIRNYYKHEYLRDLKSALNKKISLVVRDGGCGIPIIDDYKIFYDNEIYNELDVPETVEEFYNGIKDSDNLGSYIKERMPRINKNKYSNVTASFSVTEKGDVQDVKLIKGMLRSVDSSLIKAINDMGKWKGRRIKGAANVSIQIDYNDGRVFYMIVKVFIKGKDYFYTDNYCLLRGNTSDLYDGRKYDNYYPLE